MHAPNADPQPLPRTEPGAGIAAAQGAGQTLPRSESAAGFTGSQDACDAEDAAADTVLAPSGSCPDLRGGGAAAGELTDNVVIPRRYRTMYSLRKDGVLGSRRQQFTLVKIVSKRCEIPEPEEPDEPVIRVRKRPAVLPKLPPKRRAPIAPESEEDAVVPVRSLSYKDPNDGTGGGGRIAAGGFKLFRSAKPKEPPKLGPLNNEEPPPRPKVMFDPPPLLPRHSPPPVAAPKAVRTRKKKVPSKPTKLLPEKDVPLWILQVPGKLKDFDPDVRIATAQEVVDRLDEVQPYAPIVAGALVGTVVHDSCLKVRELAAKALIGLGEYAGQFTPSFVYVLQHDTNPAGRKLAIELIGAFDHIASHGATLCLVALLDSDKDVRAAAGDLFGTLDEDFCLAKGLADVLGGHAGSTVADMMEQDTRYGNWCASGFHLDAAQQGSAAVIRQRAAELFGRLAFSVVEPHVETLLAAAVYDRAAGAREAAALALNSFGGEAPLPFEERFSQILQDGDAEARKAAAIALGLLTSRPAPEALLTATLEDPEHLVRWRSAQSLGKLGAVDAESVAPPLKQLLDFAVGDLDGEKGRAAARAAAKEQAEDAMKKAAAILGGGAKADGPSAQQPDAGSQEATSDLPSPRKRQRAVDALGAAGTIVEPHLPSLGAGLKHHDASVRQGCANVLGALGKLASGQVTQLEGALDDEDPIVRCSVLAALGQLGSAAVPKLHKMSSSLQDECPTVRRASAGALGALGEAASRATEMIIVAANDVDTPARTSFVRRADKKDEDEVGEDEDAESHGGKESDPSQIDSSESESGDGPAEPPRDAGSDSG